MGSDKQQKLQSTGFTKYEDFSPNVSTKSSALFCGNTFIVSAVPFWLFWRVHNVDLLPSSIFFVLVMAANTYLMATSYKNIKFQLKDTIAVRREDVVTCESNRQLGDDKEVTHKEKDEHILWKKNELYIL